MMTRCIAPNLKYQQWELRGEWEERRSWGSRNIKTLNIETEEVKGTTVIRDEIGNEV